MMESPCFLEREAVAHSAVERGLLERLNNLPNKLLPLTVSRCPPCGRSRVGKVPSTCHKQDSEAHASTDAPWGKNVLTEVLRHQVGRDALTMGTHNSRRAPSTGPPSGAQVESVQRPRWIQSRQLQPLSRDHRQPGHSEALPVINLP